MKIALVGNQNSGKTTLFNCLTGMNAKIGNWPGVTIEKKTAIIKNTNNEITDLPGIYSLSPYTMEEEIARKFIFDEKPEVIINIIDATSLERSLYLTTQLIELDSKIIVALNMTDMIEKKGLKIDISNLEKKIGAKVIEISALKQKGIENLIEEINKTNSLRKIKIFDKEIENSIINLEWEIANKTLHRRFIAVKIIEQDERFSKFINLKELEIINKLRKKYNTDLEEIIATERYGYIETLIKECVFERKTKESITDKIDKILLNKWVAFPIFIFVMTLVYYLSVGLIGDTTKDWTENIFRVIGNNIENIMKNAGISEWINSLVVDGIIIGIGAVLGFIPQLIILFLCISILETTGYMSRIAVLLDRIFRKIGLSGKSLIPFIVGTGCSVPGIMGSRIIENQDERKMTIILTPFIPCSAKLPIIALFTGYFFEKNRGLVSASLYFMSIAVIILSAYIMKKNIFKNTSSTYISELPEYKIPSLKYIVKDVWEKIQSYIKRAGTIILVCSIIIWFFTSFSFSLEYGVNIEESILAQIGKKISWIFYPIIGVNSWGATVSAIQGVIAKEQVISSMAVISGISNKIEEGSYLFNDNGIFSFFTAASAYSFMIFNLFSAPCISSIIAMKKELGSTRNVIKAITFQTVLAWILAAVVYQIGKGRFNWKDPIVLGIITLIIVLLLKNKKNKCTECRNWVTCEKYKKTFDISK